MIRWAKYTNMHKQIGACRHLFVSLIFVLKRQLLHMQSMLRPGTRGMWGLLGCLTGLLLQHLCQQIRSEVDSPGLVFVDC